MEIKLNLIFAGILEYFMVHTLNFPCKQLIEKYWVNVKFGIYYRNKYF